MMRSSTARTAPIGTSPAAAAARACTSAARIRASCAFKSTAKVEAGYYGIIVKNLIRTLVVLALVSAFSVFPAAQTGGSGRSVGPIMARVTVDIYSDFQCPSCKLLAEQ